MKSQSIPISQIYRLPDTQPRIKIDLMIVDEYAEAMKTGAQFPPLDIFKIDRRYIVVDGYHRHRAAEQAKVKEFLCNVHEGGMRDAILFAAGANATHGLRRTNEDKHRAVERLLSDKEWSTWSDNEIAKRCNVSYELVAKLRGAHYPKTDSDKRAYTTKHGTPAKMDTTKIGRKKKAPYNGTPQPGDFKPKDPVPPHKTLAGKVLEQKQETVDQEPDQEQDRVVKIADFLSSAKYFDKPQLSPAEKETFTNIWVRKCLSKEHKGTLREIVQTGEFESNLHAIGTLIERAGEQLGGPA
jgi:hypothetical protein